MRMNLSVRSLSTRRVEQVFAAAFVCCLLLALPSCAIFPLRQAVIGPPLPTTFNGVASQGSFAQLGIAEFFNDPILTDLISQGLASNRELLIMNEEIQIASNEILARQGAWLPFVTFGSGAEINQGSKYTPLGATEDLEYEPGKHFPKPVPKFRYGLNLFWQLDIWRELRNARDAATHRYIAAIEQRNYFATRLIAEIAENYYKLMALDRRIEVLDQTIAIQRDSLRVAIARKEGVRGTELAVRRFQAEVSKNEAQKLIVNQEIIQTENRINILLTRNPQPIERLTAKFFDINVKQLSVGVPAQLLQNRPDIRQAERELAAAGLDIKVARAHFFPRVDISGGVGFEAFNMRYLFTPEAIAYNLAGNLVTPLINKKAIQAEYLSANAKQLEAVYNYQRTVLNAFTEVVNRMSKVANYSQSIEIKKMQLKALEASVTVATNLFLNARVEYVEVLLAQRDLLLARTELIDTKLEQLAAIVNIYQALGGGDVFSHKPGVGGDPSMHPTHPPALPGPGGAVNGDPAEVLPAPRPGGQNAAPVEDLPAPNPANPAQVSDTQKSSAPARPEFQRTASATLPVTQWASRPLR